METPSFDGSAYDRAQRALDRGVFLGDGMIDASALANLEGELIALMDESVAGGWREREEADEVLRLWRLAYGRHPETDSE